ncbi:MAG: CRISPR-associated protein Csx3 [Planctomycetota bacterium]
MVDRDGSVVTLERGNHPDGFEYQFLRVCEGVPRSRHAPGDLVDLELLRNVDPEVGVVVSGRAPTWMYAHLFNRLACTPWTGSFDPGEAAAIIVRSRTALMEVGERIEVPEELHEPVPAVLVVGPANSGKSVFHHTLSRVLRSEMRGIYAERAHWDGEGDYTYELQEGRREQFRQNNKGQYTANIFDYYARRISNLRRTQSLVLVDVGGRRDRRKRSMLEASTHYIIVSAEKDEVKPWHRFCKNSELRCVAVVHSTLEKTTRILRDDENQPLCMESGPWERDSVAEVPGVLLERVRTLAC